MSNREALLQWFGRGHSGVLSLTGVLEGPTPDCETYLVYPFLENGSILHHLNAFPDTDRRGPVSLMPLSFGFNCQCLFARSKMSLAP